MMEAYFAQFKEYRFLSLAKMPTHSRAAVQTGELLSMLIADKLIGLKPVAEHLLVAAAEKPADDEDTALVDGGSAAKVSCVHG